MKDKIKKAEIINRTVMEARLVYEQNRSQILASLANNYLFEYDKSKDIIYFAKPIHLHNKLVTTFGDCSKKTSLVPYIYPEDLDKVVHIFQSSEGGTVEFRYLTHDGYRWFNINITRVRSKDSDSYSFFGSVMNIHEEKISVIKNNYQKNTDPLTRLYNLSFMKESVNSYIKQQFGQGTHALVLLDILRFHEINDKYGYLFGNTILTQVANALRDYFYPSLYIGRVGADQFMIFVPNLQRREELFLRIDKVCSELSNIYTGDIKECITGVFGVSIYPEDGNTFEKLFSHCDTACYVAKKKGYGTLMFYENCRLHIKGPEKEFYSDYGLKDIHPYGYSDFDKEITTFAVDVMQRVKSVDQSVTVLLNHLATTLNVDYAKIYEVCNNHNEIRLTYSSGSKRMIQDGRNIIYEEIGLAKYESLYNHGFLVATDTKDIALLPLKKSLYEQGIHSTIQCAIYQDGIFCGCVALENVHQKHTWTERECSALYTIATLMSTYLLRLRDYWILQDKLNALKDYDQLTNLPNINKFRKDAASVMKMHGAYGKYVIVSLDFLHFKYVNDRCGFEVGDQVLYEYARMLELNESNLVIARESADKFLILMQTDSLASARIQINEMNEEFARMQKKRLLGWSLSVIAGISEVLPDVGITEAMERANIARKSIKNIHRTECCIYDEEMQSQINRELDIVSSQEMALKNHEFEIYLQPKIGLKNNELVGAEALVRWKRRDGKMMFPDEFIPIFEKNGFIIQIDFYVYEVVCQLLKRWMTQKKLAIPISVNVSRLHLLDEDFVDDFENLVNKYDLPKELLELELTESMVLENVESAIETMARLQEKGFIISIDDFGTGYSSLNLLKDMKTDILKLDKNFFRQGELKKQDKIIVSNIINMAKELDMKVLSEGVETLPQSEFLKEIACDMAQGYLFAKPMPIPDFELFMQKYL